MCNPKRIIAITVTHLYLHSHICVYRHHLQTHVVVHAISSKVHVYECPQKEWDLFSFRLTQSFYHSTHSHSFTIDFIPFNLSLSHFHLLRDLHLSHTRVGLLHNIAIHTTDSICQDHHHQLRVISQQNLSRVSLSILIDEPGSILFRTDWRGLFTVDSVVQMHHLPCYSL